jgi:hypothetical protein
MKYVTMAKQIKKPRAKIVKPALEVLSDKTIHELHQHRADVEKSSHPDYAKAKYSLKNKKHKLIFKDGRDLLQYNIVVRPYIIRKYRLEKDMELDILLYLFPIQYFTMRDFKILPTVNAGYHLNTLLEMNFIEIAIPHANGHTNNIYQLTERSKKIVTDYYEYLSGEKSVNPTGPTNPFADPKAKKIDRLRQKVLDKLTHQTKTFPKLYRRHLYDF